LLNDVRRNIFTLIGEGLVVDNIQSVVRDTRVILEDGAAIKSRTEAIAYLKE
jgi:hypothetical protein